MSWIRDMLSPDSEVSCMRAMAQEALIFAFIIGVVGMYMKEDLTKVAILCGVFVTPAFAGKTMQSKYENNQPPKG